MSILKRRCFYLSLSAQTAVILLCQAIFCIFITARADDHIQYFPSLFCQAAYTHYLQDAEILSIYDECLKSEKIIRENLIVGNTDELLGGLTLSNAQAIKNGAPSIISRNSDILTGIVSEFHIPLKLKKDISQKCKLMRGIRYQVIGGIKTEKIFFDFQKLLRLWLSLKEQHALCGRVLGRNNLSADEKTLDKYFDDLMAEKTTDIEYKQLKFISSYESLDLGIRYFNDVSRKEIFKKTNDLVGEIIKANIFDYNYPQTFIPGFLKSYLRANQRLVSMCASKNERVIYESDCLKFHRSLLYEHSIYLGKF